MSELRDLTLELAERNGVDLIKVEVPTCATIDTPWRAQHNRKNPEQHALVHNCPGQPWRKMVHAVHAGKFQRAATEQYTSNEVWFFCEG